MRSQSKNIYRGVSRFENVRPTLASAAPGKRKHNSAPENSRNIKRQKVNPYKPFGKNCDLLLELKDANCLSALVDVLEIGAKKYIHITKETSPESILASLKEMNKTHNSIRLNLIMNSKNADFTQSFNKFKHLRVVKALLSDIIVSSQHSVYNIKCKHEHLPQLLNLFYSIKFKKRDPNFIQTYTRIVGDESTENGDVIQLDFNRNIKELNTGSILSSYRKQLINIVKVQQRVVEEKLLKNHEKKQQLKVKKQARLLKLAEKEALKQREKEALKQREKDSVNKYVVPENELQHSAKQESSEAVENEEKAKSESDILPQIPRKTDVCAVSEPASESIVAFEDIFKHSMTTLTKTITSLTTTKKLKPYKIVKIYVKLPIKLYDNRYLQDMISENKYSTNIIILSYINVSSSNSYFTDELHVNLLPESAEREFKVLSIGGGISDSLKTLAEIKKDLMVKFKEYKSR